MKIIAVALLLASGTAYADIYKCEVAGKMVFSDKVCSTSAKKMDIKVYQPKAEDIEKQKQTTEGYLKDSRLDSLVLLKKKNEGLKAKINRLIKQRDMKLASFDDKIYRYSDDYIATKEPGLFKKMAAIRTDYQNQINAIKAEIKENQVTIDNFKY